MSNAGSKYRPRCCNECGSTYTPRRGNEFFCTVPCRKGWENRRMVRGRDLYDLFMAMRYERGFAKARGIWAIACRLAEKWHDEDRLERDGRKSWSAKRTVDKLPIVVTSKDVFTHGRMG